MKLVLSEVKWLWKIAQMVHNINGTQAQTFKLFTSNLKGFSYIPNIIRFNLD